MRMNMNAGANAVQRSPRSYDSHGPFIAVPKSPDQAGSARQCQADFRDANDEHKSHDEGRVRVHLFGMRFLQEDVLRQRAYFATRLIASLIGDRSATSRR
jgi:hypothetical protein